MKKVIIIGAGFGGLTAAKELSKYNIDITIIDKTNHHVFQPLLYQVATAALSPADIAEPIRSVFRDNKNVKVLLGNVSSIDKENRKVFFNKTEIVFDYLVVAPGARHAYFGKEEWEKFAPGLKTINDALKIRENILLSLEAAEKASDPIKRQKHLNFVIVGGGPTGVEIAGAISEFVNKNLLSDFRNINASMMKVYMIEGSQKILSTFPDKLSRLALEDLKELGVEVILDEMVINIDKNGVETSNRFIESTNVLWASGIQASPLLKYLKTETDKVGRAIVNDDLSIKDDKRIFVIGDAAAVKNNKGETLPAIAPVAIQQGKFIAKIIAGVLTGNSSIKFKYNDRGTLATIGKAKAVGVIKGIKLSGLIAWLSWSFIHILYLIGFRNRLRVMIEWIWYYITNRPGIRLIIKYTEEIINEK